MPRLNDHGLGGGGKSLGVPVYPFETVEGVVTSESGSMRAIYGDAITTIPFNCYSNCSCTIGDEIYIIGSSDSDATCYKYNVNTKVWTKLTNSQITGQKVWAIPYGTDIYYSVIGNQWVYKYDTVTNTHNSFMQVTGHNMGYSRATIDGDNIYIFGGNYYDESDQKRTTRVNITNKTYTRLTSIPTGMYNHGVENGGDGYIYMFGGAVNSTIAYKYSIAGGTYTIISSVPFNCYGQMTARIDNYILLINSTHSSYKQVIYAYDILNDSYTSLGTTPYARQYGKIGLVNDVIYMIGGGTSSTTYVSGESSLVTKCMLANLSIQRMSQGVRVHTNGEVFSGTVKEFGDNIVFNTETTLEKTNGVATIPSDGEYALIDANYATIGG